MPDVDDVFLSRHFIDPRNRVIETVGDPDEAVAGSHHSDVATNAALDSARSTVECSSH
jgi:hypothetical protein